MQCLRKYVNIYTHIHILGIALIRMHICPNYVNTMSAIQCTFTVINRGAAHGVTIATTIVKSVGE